MEPVNKPPAEPANDVNFYKKQIIRARDSLGYNSIGHYSGHLFHVFLQIAGWTMFILVIILAISIPTDPVILFNKISDDITLKTAIHTDDISDTIIGLKIILFFLSFPFLGIALLSKGLNRKKKKIRKTHHILEEAIENHSYLS